MKENQALADLHYVNELLERTRKEIDPGAIYFLLWGGITFIGGMGIFTPEPEKWNNLYWPWAFWIGIGLSFILTFLIMPRMKNVTHLTKQIGMIWAFFGNIMALLFIAGPGLHLIQTSPVWVIANLLLSLAMAATGIFYRKEFTIVGFIVLYATVLAMVLSTPFWLEINELVIALGMLYLGGAALWRLRSGKGRLDTASAKSD